MFPSDISINEDGVEFTWDINGDYAPVQMSVTWEEILKK